MEPVIGTLESIFGICINKKIIIKERGGILEITQDRILVTDQDV